MGDPARNRGLGSDVVLLMEGNEERSGDWPEEGPMTQRCVYVQDRDSQRWSALALADTTEAPALDSVR